jgi:hypothetical protein
MTRLRSQKAIVHEIYNGTPPPLLSREGDVNAKRLGAGLTFEAATTLQYGGPDKNTAVDPLSPPTQGPAAPDDAFAVTVGKAPAPPAPSANGELPAMEFKSSSTKHGLHENATVEVPSLMSDLGKKMASHTAPKSVF